MTVDYSDEVRRTFADIDVQNAAFGCAKQKAEQIFSRSKMVDFTDSYPKLTINEIKLGKKLGKGNFGIVYECHDFGTTKNGFSTERSLSFLSLSSAASCGEEAKEEETVKTSRLKSSRSFLSDWSFRQQGGRDPQYALKMLQEEVIKDPAMLVRASIDMALESRILSSVNHPNIIRMHASGAKSPYEANYFIVIDRLFDTLEQRIEKWAKKQRYIRSSVGRTILDPKRKKTNKILEDKLMTALDLAAAFEYLHSQNIVFRDLKPDNVGFDVHDDVKLFDFGLAKEVHEEDRDANGLYKLTGMTGAPLYMAPEVALGRPYNFSCDVYSFAMLFWHMYSCKEPFQLYRMSDMKKRVWSGEHKRPKLPEDWSLAIIGFLHSAWSHALNQRPSFQQIYKTLDEETVRVSNERDKSVELLEM